MSDGSSSPLSSLDEMSEPEMLRDHSPSDANDTTNDAQSPSAEPEAASPKGKKRKFIIDREPELKDNADVAFIVAFQSRFSSVFRGVPNMGPQNIEDGISETPISEDVELLICRLLSLCLNRKKLVEKGHYGRAMEEAITTYLIEGPWEEEHPLHGGHTFLEMSVEDRLTLVRTLVIWSLRHSESVQTILKENYKLNRKANDSNVEVAVQPWGMDRDKRKYYLIEGKDDTTFRLYQEHISPSAKSSTWYEVASTIDELRGFVAGALTEDGSRNAKELKEAILEAIPRFEEGIIKRQKREYRQRRKAQFSTYQDIGPSVYDGRTRGKRVRYNYDSDEDGGYTDNNQSGVSTRESRSRRDSPEPAAGPYTTGSGRVSRRPGGGGLLGDNMSGAATPYTASESESTRPIRSSRLRHSTAMDVDTKDEPNSGAEEDYDQKDITDDDEDVKSDDDSDNSLATSPPQLKVVLKFKHPEELRGLAAKLDKADLNKTTSSPVTTSDADVSMEMEDTADIENDATALENVKADLPKLEHDAHMVINGTDAHLSAVGTPVASN